MINAQKIVTLHFKPSKKQRSVGKFSQYKVQLSNLQEGKHEQEFECNTEFFRNMENTEVLSSDVHVHLDLEKKRDAYYLHFSFYGEITIPCDRCLDPMELPVESEYSLTVKYGESYNDESDEVLVIPYSDTYLNVAYMLYDTIMLSIPLRHVHPLGKCNRAMASVLNKHKGGIDDGDEEEIDESYLDSEEQG